MKLYKLLVGHYAPKGYHKSIEKYIVAQDESELYDLICEFTYWNDDYGTPEEFCEKHIPDWEECLEDYFSGDEGDEKNFHDYCKNKKKEFIISTKGELNSDWASYEDAYYGITHYGWELVCGIRNNEVELLKDLGII